MGRKAVQKFEPQITEPVQEPNTNSASKLPTDSVVVLLVGDEISAVGARLDVVKVAPYPANGLVDYARSDQFADEHRGRMAYIVSVQSFSCLAPSKQYEAAKVLAAAEWKREDIKGVLGVDLPDNPTTKKTTKKEVVVLDEDATIGKLRKEAKDITGMDTAAWSKQACIAAVNKAIGETAGCGNPFRDEGTTAVDNNPVVTHPTAVVVSGISGELSAALLPIDIPSAMINQECGTPIEPPPWEDPLPIQQTPPIHVGEIPKPPILPNFDEEE